MTCLMDIADVIRSKNAGPYELTLDVVFRDKGWFDHVVASGLFSRPLIARLYQLSEADIFGIVHFPPANAIKVTLRRPIASGGQGETDVYGAQQHAPLIDLVVPPRLGFDA